MGSQTVNSEDDIISITAAEYIKTLYEKGVSAEEACNDPSLRKLSDDAKAVLPIIVKAFFNKWDKEGVSDKPIEIRAGDLMSAFPEEVE